jgi:hypothetical protein
MNTDDFEQTLKRQPLRPLPAAWRTEVLAAARAAADPTPSAAAARRRSESPLAARLRSWLWPHPVAWGGVAAAWLLILALAYSTGETEKEKGSNHSLDWRTVVALRQQIEMELAGLDSGSVVLPPKPSSTLRPQSRRVIPGTPCLV